LQAVIEEKKIRNKLLLVWV